MIPVFFLRSSVKNITIATVSTTNPKILQNTRFMNSNIYRIHIAKMIIDPTK